MKKFWEKHDLIKVSGLMVLLSVILTWIIPQGYFYSGSIQVGEITRVGIFDFFNYGLLGMYYLHSYSYLEHSIKYLLNVADIKN